MSSHAPLEPAQLKAALQALGEVLDHRDVSYELVLVGGANLVLQDVITRPTKDGDLVGVRLDTGQVVKLDAMPLPLAQAVRDVAAALGLDDEWLKLGPAPLMDLGLPEGFDDRLTPRHFSSLTIWLAGRFDMICLKLYASADQWPTRGRHLQDLIALRPAGKEADRAAIWCATHDPSPAFRGLLEAVIDFLAREDRDER